MKKMKKKIIPIMIWHCDGQMIKLEKSNAEPICGSYGLDFEGNFYLYSIKWVKCNFSFGKLLARELFQ